MRTVYSFLLSYMIFFASCNNNNLATPANTVQAYLTAIDNFEFEKADALLLKTPENKAALDQVKKFASAFDESKKHAYLIKVQTRQYHIIGKEVTADKAEVIATNNEGTFTVVVTFELVKDSGKWLIKSYSNDIG